ncbi:MAG: type II secretion system F family protein [Candidatus Eremiobacteraeota bacterium]|nr:type II secretion system F family protein [Candidatus Eremiobacteraeota bacterium]MCW5867960.1 type II secretion system F family protein [Candidatus Eremiobacteraeota bacterium]
MKPSLAGREDDRWIAEVRVEGQRLAINLRQLGQMLFSGVHLVRALEALSEQPESAELAEIWWTIQATLGRGSTLSQAMGQFRSTFSPTWIHLIRVGEQTGSLVQSLIRLADHLERQQRLRRRVLSALAYPLVVLLVSLLVSLGLLHFVLPPFLDSLLSLKLELPWPTLVLLWLTGLVRHPWLPALLLLALYGARRRIRDYALEHDWDLRIYQLSQAIPLLGRCLRDYSSIRLAAAASQLLASGGDVLKSWELAVQASGDPRLSRERAPLRRHLMEGEQASVFFQGLPEVVSPLFSALLEVGENTGRCPQLLERVARDLEEDLDHELTMVTSLLQPALLALVSISTLFVILALFLPLYSQLSNL